MNERRERRDAEPPGRDFQPRYLTASARGLVQRAVRLALRPISFARLLIDLFRSRNGG